MSTALRAAGQSPVQTRLFVHRQLNRALEVLQLMRQRNIAPKEITYTCLIAGFGRSKKVEEARKMIVFITSTGIRPNCVTYNALLSGLLTTTPDDEGKPQGDYSAVENRHVDQALLVLREMMHSGIRPNAVTVSYLVLAR
jgi:pentatricopeptide repeat protein